MESSERVANDGGNEEKEHVNGLRALLHDVVRREGSRSGAARALGVDRGCSLEQAADALGDTETGRFGAPTSPWSSQLTGSD